MELVKLPKEVAEAIDYFKNGTDIDFPEQAIMKVAMEDTRYIGDPDFCDDIKEFVFSYDNHKLLMAALVNGYEVEMTPEDKVRDYVIDRKKEMRSLCEGTDHYSRAKYRYDGAMAVVELLGIKISGVNAE